MEFYKGIIPIIRRSLDEGFISGITGETHPTGCVPRDFDEDPVEMGDSPAGMQLIDPSNYDAAWEEQEAMESSLLHMFLRNGKPAFEPLNQNPNGYCWAFSTGVACMLDRMKQNLPPIRINPTATAAIIKNGADRGGWCGLSCKFGREHGWAVEGSGPGQWPGNTRNLRYDTPELRASMAQHKIVEDWYDLGRREYDQKLTQQQLFTLSFNAMPTALDYNRFAHSMGSLGVVRIERGHWGPLIIQSWPHYGYHGLAILAGMWPDNAIAVRNTSPSVR